MNTQGQMEGLTETHLLGRRVTCLQPEKGFRVAIDAVLLAAAVPALAGDTVLEAGSGSGAAALCLAARVDGVGVIGLEQQRPLAELAERNAELSGLAARVRFLAGDLLDPPAEIGERRFDHVCANPPYIKAGAGQVPDDPQKAAATIEGDARLADWMAFLRERTRDGGTVTMVHRHDRLRDIVDCLDPDVDGIVVKPLVPSEGAAPKRVLVQVTKGRGGPICYLDGLVLHETGRKYTSAADAVLRDAQPISMSERNDAKG